MPRRFERDGKGRFAKTSIGPERTHGRTTPTTLGISRSHEETRGTYGLRHPLGRLSVKKWTAGTHKDNTTVRLHSHFDQREAVKSVLTPFGREQVKTGQVRGWQITGFHRPRPK